MKQLKLFILGGVIILLGFAWYFTRQREISDGPAEEGKAAPNFALRDESGRTIRLSDYHGKVVVLNFWATWCPPCVQEAPSLELFHRRFRATAPEKLAVLTVSVDNGWEAVKQFSREKNLTFPVLLDPQQAVPHRYGTFKYPETYIIDSEGIVRMKFIGGLDWMSPPLLQDFDSFISAQRSF